MTTSQATRTAGSTAAGLPAPAGNTSAARLCALARKRRLSGRRAELEDLASALDGNGGIDRWSGIDLFSAFFQDDTIGPPATAWPGRILDIFTQALFFMPIAVTWFGLMKATEAYRQTLNLKSAAGQSFLSQWQTGFYGHLSGAFYLDRIAGYVIALILALIVLMTVQSLLHARVDDDDTASLFQELARALTSAALELAPRRVSAPEEAAAKLSDAAAEFGRTATAIREVGEIARDAQDEARKGVSAVGDALGSVETAVTAAGGAATAAGTAASGAEAAADAMARQVTKLTTTAEAVVTAEAAVAGMLKDTQGKLGSSVDGVTAKIGDSIKASQAQVAAAVRDSSAKIADSLSAGSAEVRSALAEVSATGAAYASQVEQATDLMGQASQTIQAIPGAVSGLEAGMASVATQVGGLGQAVASARSALPGDGGLSADLRATLSNLSAAAASLQSAAVALQAAARVQPARPRRRPRIPKLW